MRAKHISFILAAKNRMILDHFVEGQSHKIKGETRKSVRLNDENRQIWHRTFFNTHSDTPESE